MWIYYIYLYFTIFYKKQMGYLKMRLGHCFYIIKRGLQNRFSCPSLEDLKSMLENKENKLANCSLIIKKQLVGMGFGYCSSTIFSLTMRPSAEEWDATLLDNFSFHFWFICFVISCISRCIVLHSLLKLSFFELKVFS